MHIEGTIRHLDLEGGVWVLEGDDGTTWNPTNLPEGFRTEGLEVEAEARIQEDAMSMAMVGPLIEIVRIRRTR